MDDFKAKIIIKLLSIELYCILLYCTVLTFSFTAQYSNVLCCIFMYFPALLYYIGLECWLLADPDEARGCSKNTAVIQSVMVCENIFTTPPRPNGCKWDFQSWNTLC